jgi:hypothetical protein
VACGKLTLAAHKHAARGTIKGPDCNARFNVRCIECYRQKVLPDSRVYRPHWELSDVENVAAQSNDGRLVFYEVM